jgi:hypothetical protein
VISPSSGPLGAASLNGLVGRRRPRGRWLQSRQFWGCGDVLLGKLEIRNDKRGIGRLSEWKTWLAWDLWCWWSFKVDDPTMSSSKWGWDDTLILNPNISTISRPSIISDQRFYPLFKNLFCRLPVLLSGPLFRFEKTNTHGPRILALIFKKTNIS